MGNKEMLVHKLYKTRRLPKSEDRSMKATKQHSL
jgi:hypothetical protein